MSLIVATNSAEFVSASNLVVATDSAESVVRKRRKLLPGTDCATLEPHLTG